MIIAPLILYLCYFCVVISEKIEPRRDAEYPPPGLLAISRVFHDMCVEETGVSEEAITQFSDVEIHEDEKLKCYMYCLFEKLNVVDKSGNLQLAKLQSKLPLQIRDISINMGKTCIIPTGNTPCEKAFWFNKCWKTADPKHYFLI